ncbi:MAG: hypothetical protein HY785_10300 [Oscillatoriophycideae cyanobacterium NC_groundwater_1537_Pr4_S-0.65um_50_18]|nr:hypothetical protein [Oscillatoriophycideae cyanobacterium NC_groundwater_1537_Pr4_S-0.65um_50_18]
MLGQLCRVLDLWIKSKINAYRRYLPEIEQQITDTALNGSGIRDTAQVLKMRRTMMIEGLKKIVTFKQSMKPVWQLLNLLKPLLISSKSEL